MIRGKRHVRISVSISPYRGDGGFNRVREDALKVRIARFGHAVQVQNVMSACCRSALRFCNEVLGLEATDLLDRRDVHPNFDLVCHALSGLRFLEGSLEQDVEIRLSKIEGHAVCRAG
jgi:hypothetical protein